MGKCAVFARKRFEEFMIRIVECKVRNDSNL